MYFSWSHWNDVVSSIKGGFEAMAGLIRVGQNWKRQFRPCCWYLNYNSPSALQNIRRRHPKPCINVQTKSADPQDDMNVCVNITSCNGNSNHIWIICLETCWNSRSCSAAETQTTLKSCLKRKALHTEDLLLLTVASLNLLHWTWIQLFLLYERGRLADSQVCTTMKRNHNLRPVPHCSSTLH